MERRVEPARSKQFAQKKAEVAERLRAVCSNFPEEEFHKLVERLARLEIKYASRGDGSPRQDGGPAVGLEAAG
jgi:hypothetical protein